MSLDSTTQDVFQQLFKDRRFNESGCFKRAANIWLLFRSDVLAEIDAKGLTQTEVTAMAKIAWKTITPEQLAKLKERAEVKDAEIRQVFPDYQYRPFSPEEKIMWSNMSAQAKRSFWFASAVRIVKRIAYPEEPWEGLLSLSSWAEENMPPRERPSEGFEAETVHSTTIPSAIVPSEDVARIGLHATRRAQRGIGSNSDLSTKISDPKTRGSHPYRDAQRHTSTQAAIIHHDNDVTPPEWLQPVLVYIGPSHEFARRRLVLSTFQAGKRVIWVEEEVRPDFPDEYLKKCVQNAPTGNSRRNIIIRNYSNPQIPAAVDEEGDLYIPSFLAVSEFRQYLNAHEASTSTGNSFTWNGETLWATAGSGLRSSLSPLNSNTPSLTAYTATNSPLSQYSPAQTSHESPSDAQETILVERQSQSMMTIPNSSAQQVPEQLFMPPPQHSFSGDQTSVAAAGFLDMNIFNYPSTSTTPAVPAQRVNPFSSDIGADQVDPMWWGLSSFESGLVGTLSTDSIV